MFDAETILKLWQKWGHSRLGKYALSNIFARAIPYTGSISPHVEKISEGSTEVWMKDSRAVRNHLQSVHAIALANLGEFATGLSVVSSLPQNGRAILKSIQIEYLKKARGLLKARAQFPKDYFSKFPITQQSSLVVEGSIFDASETCVAKVKAEWVVGPKTKS